MKIVVDIPEKTNAHIRSDYGHFVTAGVMALREEDKDILCYAIYHGTPYEERPHGEWERNPQIRTLITRTCNACGGRSAVGNFCMWCGSDNRVKEGEQILDEAIDGEGKDGNVKEGEKEMRLIDADNFDEVPTVEQKPHGEWIESKERKGHFYCSECVQQDATGKWRELFDYKYKFCPNCGAEMQKKEGARNDG